MPGIYGPQIAQMASRMNADRQQEQKMKKMQMQTLYRRELDEILFNEDTSAEEKRSFAHSIGQKYNMSMSDAGRGQQSYIYSNMEKDAEVQKGKGGTAPSTIAYTVQTLRNQGYDEKQINSVIKQSYPDFYNAVNPRPEFTNMKKTMAAIDESVYGGDQGPQLVKNEPAKAPKPEEGRQTIPHKSLKPYWKKMSDEERKTAERLIKEGMDVNKIIEALNG
jgi:hypothetical protein